jgi:hypothetical protein
MNPRSMTLLVIGALVALASVAATDLAAVRDTAVPTDAPNIRGDFRVTLELTRGNGDTSTETEEGCSQIDFHPDYVVLRQKAGGRLVPLRLIHNMRWQGK